MHKLFEIYEALKEEGFCANQAEFSTFWLGRSAHYMSQIKGRADKASLTSLNLLASRLEVAVFVAGALATGATYRRLRTAFVSARSMCDGEYELRHLPNWYRVTAVAAD